MAAKMRKQKASAMRATFRRKKASPQKPARHIRPTPYRSGSCYQNIIEALQWLGVGKFHPWEKIVASVELPRGFKSKAKRTVDGLGWKDRVKQNVRTLARGDYGRACRDVLRQEVRTNGSAGAGLFRLKRR